jgi:hypothetical protein
MISSKIPVTIIIAGKDDQSFEHLKQILKKHDANYEYEIIILKNFNQLLPSIEFVELNHTYVCGMFVYNNELDIPKTLKAALESSNGDYVIFNAGNPTILEHQITSIARLDNSQHGFMWAKQDSKMTKIIHPFQTLIRFMIKVNDKVELVGSSVNDFIIDRYIAQDISSLSNQAFWPSFYRLLSERKIVLIESNQRSWIEYQQLEFHYSLTLSSLNQMFMQKMNRFLSAGLLYILGNTASVAFFKRDVWGNEQTRVPGWATLTILMTVFFIVMNYSIGVMIELIRDNSETNNGKKQSIQKYLRFTQS